MEYIVFIRHDNENRITEVNSSAFISDVADWVAIDQGYEQSYHHAQGSYFPKPLYDDRYICRYMTAPITDDPEREAFHTYEYEDEQWGIYERTKAEMDADWVEPTPPTDEKQLEIDELKQQVAALSAALLDL